MSDRSLDRTLRLTTYGPEVNGEPAPFSLASNRPVMIQKVDTASEHPLYEVTLTAYFGSVEVGDTDCWVGQATLSDGAAVVWDNTFAVHAANKPSSPRVAQELERSALPYSGSCTCGRSCSASTEEGLASLIEEHAARHSASSF